MKTSVLKKFMVGSMGQQDTRTPLSIFNTLNEEFDFDLDPCTSSSMINNLGTPNYFTEKDNGLIQSWKDYKRIFINPPFKDISKWVNKIEEELVNDKIVVLFVPSKTETVWWHKLINNVYLKELRFLERRVKFEGHKGAFIFGITIMIFTNTKWEKS